ncbi:hypothetical protein Hanom_Chr03g00246171 [Helianthus anomalus]
MIIIKKQNPAITSKTKGPLTAGGFFTGAAACLLPGSTFDGESCLPPVFFSSRALLKITVKPSAEAGSFTSQSPNFGNGLPFSSCQNT